MTSRVQKGGTIFKPVVKSRPRSATTQSRQTSIVQDHHTAESHNVQLEGTAHEAIAPILIQDTLILPHERHSIPPILTTSQKVKLPTLQDRTGPTNINTPMPPTLIAAPRPIFTSERPNSSVTTHVSVVASDQAMGALSVEFGNATGSPSALDLNIHQSNPLLPESSNPTHPGISVQPISHASDNSSSPKKRRKSQSVNEGYEELTLTKQPKSMSGTDQIRRSRVPSLPPFDPNANPGEEIDPTVVTMAALCSDTGQGRVSSKAIEILSNHASWKLKNREKRARMRAMMEAKKYGRDGDEDSGNQETTEQTNYRDQPSAEPGASLTTSQGDTAPAADEFDYTQDLVTSRFNVQVRIGPNGETIIDEDSLVVDRVEGEDTEHYTHVVESDTTKFVNSGTYGKRFRGSRWSAEETELFYDALSQYGENYELIAYVLPGRDRKACKNKFKIEDRKNHARINYCLENSIPVDIKTLSRMTGKDFSGPVPEIKIPKASAAHTVVAEEVIHVEDGSSRPQKARKRSRSRPSASNDEAVIIGDVDNFDT